MKRNLSVFLLLIALLAIALPARADTTYVDVSTTVCDADGTYLLCHGTFNMGDDSTGTFFTPEIHIAPANEIVLATKYGWVGAVVSEVDTANIALFAEYSPDGNLWFADTTAIVTDIGTSELVDTLGVTDGVLSIRHQSANYMRLRFVGQDDNSAGGVIRWYVYLPKRPGAGTGFRGLMKSS